jgi:branched-chain amino acid transport system permease protein
VNRHALAFVALLAGVTLVLALPAVLSPFAVRVVQNVFFAAALATAWNIMGGFAGYWSFGHTGFLGIGAFSGALLQEHVDLGGAYQGLVAGIALGAALAAALALLLAYPILRLRGAYFSIAMLGVSLVLSELASNVDFIEGGIGISLPPVGPSWLAPEIFYYFVFLALLAVSLGVAAAIRASKLNYGLAAIREDEDTAPMLGVPTLRYKTIVFVLSAALTGAIGAAYASSLGYITSDSGFRADLGLDIVVYCLLGGIGTLTGPVLGAALMIVLTQVVVGGLLQIHLLVTGVLITVIVLLLPDGIVGAFRRRRAATVQEPASKTAVVQPPPARAVEQPVMAPVLTLENISVQFRGLRALSGVSIAVPPGCIFSIIGPNGAGKSTLFNVVTAYRRPSGGVVHYRGQRIDQLSTLALSRMGIARAFQIARPFQGMTVFENIMVGALFGKAGSRDARAVAEAALHVTGLAGLRDEPALGLPIGHLRRLELARVIATRPDLILADEPCAGLNATETLDVVRILRDVRAQGTTVVLVEHDMATIMRISDRVCVIAAGLKICEGSPDEVVQDAGVIEAYLGKPASKPTKSGLPIGVQA